MTCPRLIETALPIRLQTRISAFTNYQDPIPQLEQANLFRAVQYLVDEENWETKGAEVALE